MNANPLTNPPASPSRVTTMFANVWSRSIRSCRVSERTKHALVGLIVSFVVLGTLVGAGAGIGMGAAADDTEQPSTAFTGPMNETAVSLAQESGPQDDFVIVRPRNNELVSGESVNETSNQGFITHKIDGEEEYLIVGSSFGDERLEVGGYQVEVDDSTGDTTHVQRVDGSPDLETTDGDHIVVDPEDGGKLKTASGDEVVVDTGDGNEVLTYDQYDKAILEAKITNINDPAEGEDLIINTSITNHGYDNYAGERTISWGGETNEEPINVNPESQINESFVFETESGDSSPSQVEFEVADQSVTRDVNIEEAEIIISDFGTTTVVAGDDLQIGAEFERIGDVPVEDLTAEFIVGNETVETDSLEIDPGDTEDGEITYETSASDAPELEVGIEIPELGLSNESTATIISQDNHEDNMSVGIPADELEIGNFSEELEVTGEFEYNGDEIPNGETDIPTEFLVNGTVVEERDVTIDESPYEETFTWEFNESTVPIDNVSLETPGGSNVTEFDRDINLKFEDFDETFSSSEPLEATVSVENDGEVPEFQNLTVGVEDANNVASNATQTQEFLLNASERTEETFSFDLTANASSGVELIANTTTVSENVTVNRSVFEASDLELDGASNPSSNLSMSGNITNTGDLTDTQTVQFVLDGETVFEEDLTLESSESETISGDFERPEEGGEYDYGITTNNESLNASSAIQQSATIEGSSSQGLLDRISLVQFGAAVLGLLALVGILLIYQNNSEEFRSKAGTLVAGAQSAVQGIIGGGDTVVVENDLSRDATVRLRVRDSNEVFFLEDLTLADGEQREFKCLPDSGEFEVGAGVDDIDSHAEVFQTKPNGVGIRLEPDGISITEQ